MSKAKSKSAKKRYAKVVKTIQELMEDDSIDNKEKLEFLEYIEGTVFEWQLELETEEDMENWGDLEDDEYCA